MQLDDTPFDYDAHKKHITMSRLHILYGLDYSKSEHFLLKVMRGEVVETLDEFGERATEFGKAWEPVTLNALCLNKKREIFAPPMCVIDEAKIGGTIDGAYYDDDGNLVIIEVKWRTYPNPDTAKIGSVKLKQYCQLQGYLGLYNAPYGILADCSRTEGIRCTYFSRDADFWAQSYNRMKTFMETVLTPNAMWPRRKAGSKQQDFDYVEASMKNSYMYEEMIPIFAQ